MTRTRGLVIRLSLVPGHCRWCQCTDHKPCTENCSWVDRTHTLCSECWPLDEAMRTARGRKALAATIQEELALHFVEPDKPKRRTS
jgi:hypothetical protein